MIRTSYALRFFARAARRLSCDQLRRNAVSCLFTSCRVVVFAVNSYVAGNRKPSRFGGLPSVRNWGGTLDEPAVKARYREGESLGSTFRLASAILLTSPIRVAICSRVNPSGKMMRSVFGV